MEMTVYRRQAHPVVTTSQTGLAVRRVFLNGQDPRAHRWFAFSLVLAVLAMALPVLGHEIQVLHGPLWLADLVSLWSLPLALIAGLLGRR